MLCAFFQHAPSRKHNLLCILPRSFLKTTTTALYTLWRAVQNPSLRILFVSNTAPNAKKTVLYIMGIVEQNRLFAALFPEVIPNFNRVRELVLDGAIGELKAAWAWGNRQIRRKGYLPKKGEPPEYLNYDLWLGPSPFHPYNPGYFGGCLSWNMYWDFGSGQIGDMGSHTMDLAWNAIDAGLPTSAVAHGEPFNPEVTPVDLTATFEHPANDWRPPIRLTWYQGAHKPNRVAGIDVEKIGHGVLFEGDKGYLAASFTNHELFPLNASAGLDHYTPRPEAEQIPPMGGFQEQWINACKTDLKTSCDFDYSGKMTEMMNLGLVAYRVGRKISYDGKKGAVTDCPEADALLKKKYRPGWTLNG